MQFAGQPVVFLEYNVDVYGARLQRWFAAQGGGSATLPLAMVDSGHQIQSGYLNFNSVYSGMVNSALARAPKAALTAVWTRSGDRVNFSIAVQNQSGVNLSNANQAAIHAIVYEDARVQLTGRFVRAVATSPINSLANGATSVYNIQTAALTGVNWSNLHYLVLVDYLPGGSSAYDMLQAAFAIPPAALSPEKLVFLSDPGGPATPGQSITIQAAADQAWSASTSASWLKLTPASGVGPGQVQVSIEPGLLSPGWQQTTLSFSLGSGVPIGSIEVSAYQGALERGYLPVIRK